MRVQQQLLITCLGASLACGPTSVTGSSDDEAGTSTGETDMGDGDGDGDDPMPMTLVAVQHITSGSPTLPNPPDQIEIVAVDLDAAEPTPIHVTDLGPGGGLRYAYWFEGHGQVLQAGDTNAPAPAKLVRFADGELIATPIAPASTVGRVRRLAFNPDGSGALVELTSSFDFIPEPPEDCSLLWVEYGVGRQPIAATELEPALSDCSENLPELELDAAGELAAWLVVVGDDVHLRVIEIDGVPGPIQTLAVAPRSLWDYGLFVDADKLGVTLDLDSDGEPELVVHDRANLDAPPTTYPFAGPSEYASWSEDGDWVVWRAVPGMDVMFMGFDGLVPSTPVALTGPEVAEGFGEWITSEGKVRFVYSAPPVGQGADPVERRGFAEVTIGPDGPGPATPITAPLADDEEVWVVENRWRSSASAYAIRSVPADGGTNEFAVIDTGSSPIEQRGLLEIAADFTPYTEWAPGQARRFLVIEMQPQWRVHLVDLEAPEPAGELLADGFVGSMTLSGAGWSASGERVILHLSDEEGTAPEALARVPVSGGEPELVLSFEGAYIDGWWTVYESE
jgi:hypothetical protein